MHLGDTYSFSDVHLHFEVRDPASRIKPFFVTSAFSSFEQSPRPEVVVIQLSSPDNKSQIDAWLKSMMLIQGIFMTIGSALASVFAWLGYRRGRDDLKLKELQIREMEIRIENMERERARAVQEASQISS